MTNESGAVIIIISMILKMCTLYKLQPLSCSVSVIRNDSLVESDVRDSGTVDGKQIIATGTTSFSTYFNE